MLKYLSLVVSLFLISPPVFADEGMWTLNDFPVKKVKEKYGFEATHEWLENVQLSAARIAGGCSASFVSGDGLIMTNNHCARSCLEQLSKSGKDYVANGFYAKTLEDEVKCPTMEINRLTEITDVTDQVVAATQGLEAAAYNDAQKAVMSQIEKDCAFGADSIRCDVVSLYHGGKYNLYKYRRFQDVRLVMSPELSMAYFGGDPDNFMFPRYDLDLSLLRVYDEGKPFKANPYFHWSKESAKEGDLTFVTGNPGRTSRLLTVVELEFQRDVSLLYSMFSLAELRGLLTEFQNRGPEQRRISESYLKGVENSYKGIKGRLEALTSSEFFDKKRAEEAQLRKRVKAKPALQKAYGSAWDEIKAAQKRYKEIYFPFIDLERNRDWGSELYGIARTLVRAAEELPKENSKRYREFAESNLPHIKQQLFSDAPIHDDLEIAMLTYSLTKVREHLTADNPEVKRLLGVQSPAEIAEKIVHGTTLKDIAVRKKLFEGGKAAIDQSQDPMIQFARLADLDARKIRKVYEDEVESVLKRSGEKVAKAYFAVYGSGTYPDATFTLRVSYGKIQGYTENGHQVNPITTIGGAFDRNTGRDPFALPPTWIRAKADLDLTTPLNFCSTNDIIGGNSGSPVINKNAEIVGLIFDGNIQSLGGDFSFDESVNRAVAVHSAGILEALRKVYHADRIVSELTK